MHLGTDGVDATDGEKFWEACELQRLDLSFNQIAELPAEVQYTTSYKLNCSI